MFAVNLHSKDEWVRASALVALERLAARCSQAAAARALLAHAFAAYNGVGGKLTSSEDKIAVLMVTPNTIDFVIVPCNLLYNTQISASCSLPVVRF